MQRSMPACLPRLIEQYHTQEHANVSLSCSPPSLHTRACMHARTKAYSHVSLPLCASKKEVCLFLCVCKHTYPTTLSMSVCNTRIHYRWNLRPLIPERSCTYFLFAADGSSLPWRSQGDSSLPAESCSQLVYSWRSLVLVFASFASAYK